MAYEAQSGSEKYPPCLQGVDLFLSPLAQLNKNKSRHHEILSSIPYSRPHLSPPGLLPPNLPTQPWLQIALSTNEDPFANVAATSLILTLPKINTPETSAFNSLFAHPLISIATNESNPSA